MKKVLFSKYSNERDKKFAIRTDIVCEKGKKVEKHAMYPEGMLHLKKQADYYEKYKDIYIESCMKLARCEFKEAVLEYQYLDGITLCDILDNMIADKQYEQAAEKLCDFCSRIRKLYSQEKWVISDEFRKVFGDAELENVMGCSFADIDLVPENIIMCDDGQYIMDYEWIFDFPIPADYVAFRAIRTFMYSGGKRRGLKEADLYAQAGIDSNQIMEYQRMEDNFQAYVYGGRVTMMDMYSAIGKTVYRMPDIMNDYVRQSLLNRPTVYYDYGNGFSEENKSTFRENIGRYEVNIPQGVRTVRFDPCGYPCVVCKIRLSGETITENTLGVESNGIWMGDVLMFVTDDPQFIITSPRFWEQKGLLTIETEISKIRNEAGQFLADVISDRRHVKESLYERSHNPIIGNRTKWCIENTNISDTGKITISGWCFSKDRHIRRGVLKAGESEYRLQYGISRDDVYAVYNKYENAKNSGFFFEGLCEGKGQNILLKFYDEADTPVAYIKVKN